MRLGPNVFYRPLHSSKSLLRGKMPPKKAQEDKKVLLGRPSNNLKIGIVGLPNVGKSTFFNTITKCDLGKMGESEWIND